MSLYIGNDKIGSLYLGSTKIKEAWVGNVKVYGSGDPYNPLNLPPFTIRIKYRSGLTPTQGDSQILVDPNENIWDITKNDTSWNRLFADSSDLIEVLGANTTSIMYLTDTFIGCTSLTSVALFDTRSCTNMDSMFYYCTSLTSVPLFDTSSCTYMGGMFRDCRALTTIPLFDTRSCTNMSGMFWRCYNVESGSLALYQQASTQATPPTSHSDTFRDCGRDTVTGAAELAQIPRSWGGTMAPV